jgi:hypothetical protein
VLLDVPDILAFLSWQIPLDGAVPNGDERDSIECDRMVIFETGRAALLQKAAK